MELSSELISQFARVTNDEPTVNEGSTVYATYRLQGESAYVQIDGSDTITPVATTAGAKSGDRVTVLIKDHKAVVTGNLTDPSASKSVVDEIGSNLDLGLSGLNDTVRNLKSDVSGINSNIETIGNDINGISSTVSGLNNTIQSVSNDVSDLNDGINNLKTDVNLKYTDINGNIQTLSGELETISGQVTGMVASIEGAAKVATNFIKFVEPYGLIIGDLTGDTLGFNTLIDATSLNMRYNSTVLAKYTADTIYLGYASSSSKIDMCGGNFRIDTQSKSNGAYKYTVLSSINDYLEIGVDKDSHEWLRLYPRIEIDRATNRVSIHADEIFAGGYLTCQTSDFAWADHTHSQYYESGDNINVGKITSSYTYGDTVDYSTNMYVGTSGILHRTTKTSSRTVKHDIKPIENADILPEKLYDVDVIQFVYNEGQLGHSSKRYGKELPGFIVEDLVEKYPIAVDIDEEDKPFQWNEQYLIPPMLALIQKQKKKLDELESRINALENKEV